jgi:hypothetical protein
VARGSKGCRFVADVHSHPICGIQEFSYEDYILSCGGALTTKKDVIRRGGDVIVENRLSIYEKARDPHIKFLVGVQLAWSMGYDYKKDEVVTYKDTFWIAKTGSANRAPNNEGSYWKEIKDYRANPNDKDYKVGEIVFDRGIISQYKEESFWEKVDDSGDPWYQHRIYWSELRLRPWMLTKFMPPSMQKAGIADGVLANKMYTEYNEMMKNPKAPSTWRSEHEIIKENLLTEQRMKVVAKWDPKLKWEHK